MRPGWIHVVAFPAAQGDGANLQSASGFRLEDFQLEATATKVAANGVWFFWNRNTAVVGWQILVSGHAQDPFTKRQRRAQVSLPFCEFFGTAHARIGYVNRRILSSRLLLFQTCADCCSPLTPLLDLHFALYLQRRLNPDSTLDFLGRSWPVNTTQRKIVTIMHHPEQRASGSCQILPIPNTPPGLLPLPIISSELSDFDLTSFPVLNFCRRVKKTLTKGIFGFTFTINPEGVGQCGTSD